MATSPETFSKVKNLLRKMDQSIDSARAKRVTASTAPPPQPQPMLAPPPPTHSIHAAVAANNNPIRARAMARPILQQRPAV